MPELPEVETIARELGPRLVGRHIVSVDVLHPRIVRHSPRPLEEALQGRRISAVQRHGKFLLVQTGAEWLTIHLGMTGQLLFDAPPSKHTRAIIRLDDSTLLYEDIRMFGSLESGRDRVDELGPDALESGWHQRLRGRNASVKALLLNQSLVAGIGNIYCDEALFRAGIPPQLRSNRLSRARAEHLEHTVHGLLEEAIACRGSSVSDYVDTNGQQGGFQLRHRVYARAGQPCVTCATPIRRSIVAQRGTHFCPACQKR